MNGNRAGPRGSVHFRLQGRNGGTGGPGEGLADRKVREEVGADGKGTDDGVLRELEVLRVHWGGARKGVDASIGVDSRCGGS